MLKSLHIENMAVIRTLDLELQPGLVCLTGETGAGKTLIVGSLSMLLGGKVSKDLIRTGEKKAVVSALFTDLAPHCAEVLASMGLTAGENLLLQKSIDQNGRSSTWCNGQAITAAMHRQIGEMLLSIHGQNENQRLLQKGEQYRLLDQYAHAEDLAASYGALYRRLRELEEEHRNLTRDASEMLREREMLDYEIREIDALKLKPGEEEAEEAMLEKLKHAEKIEKQLTFAYHLLRGSEKAAASMVVEKAADSLDRIGPIVPEVRPLVEELEQIAARLDQLSSEITDLSPRTEGDVSAQIDKLESRLHALARLKRKYGQTVEEILSFRADAQVKRTALDSHEDRLIELEEEIRLARTEAGDAAEQLSRSRSKAARKIEREVQTALAFLDMPNVRFQICLTPARDLGPNGRDELEFLLAANPGQEPAPLSRCASGGELARIMLSIKSVFNSEASVDVSVFDEVDTGISGKTARKVGLKLKGISRTSQVICVTHSAQIASLADQHLQISKTTDGVQTEAHVTELGQSDRVEELARILGGLHVTDAQRRAALDMMQEDAAAGGA